MALAPGVRFGCYEIVDAIGAGGMGEVYRARDTTLHRDVAIKVLPTEFARDPDRIARFRREAQVLASINHPNIAHVCGLEEADGLIALVMELVDGSTLLQFAAASGGRLPWPEAVTIARQIADTLSAVHERGIVHRDLKPANVKVSSSGLVKVLDFGLAKPSPGSPSDAQPSGGPQTQSGFVVGTVAYMSPEQARGQAADARSDLWSLGVVLYEMVTGRAPFRGETQGHQLVAVLEHQPVPIARLAPDVPAELEAIVKRALAKRPEDRYQRARDFAADLTRLERSAEKQAQSAGDPDALTSLAPVVAAASPPVRATAAPAARVAPWAVAVAAGIILASVAGGYAIRSRQAAVAGDHRSIDAVAVLPFEQQSASQDDQYLADGFSESLINALASLPNVKVISRNSAFSLRGATAKAAGQRLGVPAVVTGTVRRVGGQLVVSVELVDVAADRQLWGERYTRTSGDVLTTQADIARAVGARIRDKLTGAEDARLGAHPTESAAAYEAYLQSRFFEAKLEPKSMVVATEYAGTAVRLDPSFSLAWSTLGRIWLERGMYFDKPSEAMPKAMDAARHAVSLAPDLTDPHIVIGLVNLLYHWNWDEAKRELMGGDSLRPQVVDTFTCSAHLLETAGHGPEAEREIRQALASDPVSVALKTELGCNSYYQRRYQTAIEEYRRSLELDTGYVIALWGLGRAYAQTKEYDRAIAELKRVEAIHGDAPPMVIGEMGYVYGLAGDRKSAMGVLATLETMSQTIWVDPYLRAIVYLGLGDRTKTLAWLDQAVAVHSPFIPSISSDAKWDAYQSDPTFAALLSRLKLRPAVVAKHSG